MFHHGAGFGIFPFGLLSMVIGLLLLAGIVLFAVWAGRSLLAPPGWRGAGPPASPPAAAPAGTPLDILARRFASGEITADEYRKIRDVLQEPPPKT